MYGWAFPHDQDVPTLRDVQRMLPDLVFENVPGKWLVRMRHVKTAKEWTYATFEPARTPVREDIDRLMGLCRGTRVPWWTIATERDLNSAIASAKRRRSQDGKRPARKAGPHLAFAAGIADRQDEKQPLLSGRSPGAGVGDADDPQDLGVAEPASSCGSDGALFEWLCEKLESAEKAAGEPVPETVGEGEPAAADSQNSDLGPVVLGIPPSTGPKKEFGGIFGVYLASKYCPRLLRRIQRALDRVFRALSSGETDDSPRTDSRKLAREIVSRRMALGRAKAKHGKRLIVIALDVSGSCAVVCAEMAIAAATAAYHNPRVVVVVHSNGIPFRVAASDPSVPPIAEECRSEKDAIAFWSALEPRTGGAIWLTDDQASWAMPILDRGGKNSVWLDDLGSTHGVRVQKKKIDRWSPRFYAAGVASAEAVAFALENVDGSA